jgi:hypothetical protein
MRRLWKATMTQSTRSVTYQYEDDHRMSDASFTKPNDLSHQGIQRYFCFGKQSYKVVQIRRHTTDIRVIDLDIFHSAICHRVLVFWLINVNLFIFRSARDVKDVSGLRCIPDATHKVRSVSHVYLLTVQQFRAIRDACGSNLVYHDLTFSRFFSISTANVVIVLRNRPRQSLRKSYLHHLWPASHLVTFTLETALLNEQRLYTWMHVPCFASVNTTKRGSSAKGKNTEIWNEKT